MVYTLLADSIAELLSQICRSSPGPKATPAFKTIVLAH